MSAASAARVVEGYQTQLRPDEPACVIEIPQFEGPLDLLLHLIQQHELDILDIPIGFVTERYLAYLDMMKALSIDVASEYLVMAATLVHIKSKMLLPVVPDDQNDDLDEEPLDPRADLVRRLLEYQRYKNAAEQLSSCAVEGLDVFGRGRREPVDNPGPAPVASTDVFLLIGAFQGLAERRRLRLDHQVDFERITITERIHQISTLLERSPRLSLDALLPPSFSRADLVVTFLAMLEMARLRMILISQPEHLGPIVLTLAVTQLPEQPSCTPAAPS